MLLRPFLAVLPWLFVAFAEAAEQPVTEPAASDAATGRAMDGKLLGWNKFDGHLFLALGREPGPEEDLHTRISLLVGWNPAFAGFSHG